MSSENHLWRSALQEVRAGRRLVLATVVGAKGSVPRELGARMLLGETGVVAGTVGGGCGEAEVLVTMRKAIAGEEFDCLVDIDLSGSLEQKKIQACGGRMDVGVRYLTNDDLVWLEPIAEAEESLKPLALVEQLGGLCFVEGVTDIPAPVGENLPEEGGKRYSFSNEIWFAQRIGNAQRLYIVGSGHVARPLCEFAAKSAFRVTIVDDRPSYVTKAHFPDAVEHCVGVHEEILSGMSLDERSSVVIITRGHQHDMASLRASLEQSPAYVGMIGSRRRALETLRALREEGYSEEKLAAVHSPIGLDIGALTPAEIAIAILGELIRQRRGGSGLPLREVRPGL